MDTPLPNEEDQFTTNDVVERLAQAAHKAIDRAAARAEALGDLHDDWMDSATNHVREKPLTSLLVALAAGLVIDRLLG